MPNREPVIASADLRIGALRVTVYESNAALGQAAASAAAHVIQTAVGERGSATVVLATGNSQLSFIEALRDADVPWAKTRIFHLDQYVGIADDHSASFSRYMRDRLVDHVQPMAFHPISGNQEKVTATIHEYDQLLRHHPADVAAIGIGENGHLAFNDPPEAQFDDPALIRLVRLAEASRSQQVGEGHFETIDDVPTHALTMTIPAIIAARHVFAMVPELRKADAVRRCLTQPISEEAPGSILRVLRNARLFLDADSSSRLISRVA